MKFVFDNIIFSKEKQGGISAYWYELIKNFTADKRACFYEEKKSEENIFRKKLVINNCIRHKQLPLPIARLLPVSFNHTAERILYHSSFYRKPATRSAVCEITTVHDFIHNKFASASKRTLHNKLKYGSIKRSQGIICVSDHTYKDLKKYCAPTKSQRVAVIHNGVSDEYRLLARAEYLDQAIADGFRLTDKFLLFVGARSNYKNFGFVTALLSELPGYKLVVVGNNLTETEKKTMASSVWDRVVVARSISNTELNILYNFAHALLYPSSYEGFGIPVVEAMKAGCPVIAMNQTSIPEVAAGAALLYDKLETSEVVKGVVSLEQQGVRSDFVHKGLENAKRFDWSRCIEETTGFYQEVWNDH